MRLDQTIDTADFRASAILLVEDDESDILLLRRAFRNARIANPLVEVRDGQAAIQYLAGEGPYSDRARYPVPFLMLLDLRLPKLSGFEVLAWIRDQPDLAGLISVVLTASDHVRDVTKAHDLGANSYLVKPGNFDELVEMVKRIKGHWLIVDRLPGLPASSAAPRHPT
jgi:CheY-like chemotaxis protein